MSKVPTKIQISAGGVAFREQVEQIEVVVISVGDDARWQLPKGLVDKGESTEAAAVREVREEAVEYWYLWNEDGRRVRYHKFVYFYLLRYKSGDVRDHDDEVNEARWVAIDDAVNMLAFENEKKILAKASVLLG